MADEPQDPKPAPDQRDTDPSGRATSTVTEGGPGPGTGSADQGPGGAGPGDAAHRGPGQPESDQLARFFMGVRAGWSRGIGLLASAVLIVAVVAAVILAVHILFVVFGANPHNSIVEFINRWSADLAWRFSSLFTPHNQKLAAVANYGIAAIAYLIAGRIAAGILRRLG
jgi:hypothetical protein